MPNYYFVGSESAHANLMLRHFGQCIQVADAAEAEHAIMGGCPLLSEEEFASCNFTPKELEAFYSPGRQLAAPASFKEKRQKAWILASGKYTSIHEQARTRPALGTALEPIDLTGSAPVAAAEEAIAV